MLLSSRRQRPLSGMGAANLNPVIDFFRPMGVFEFPAFCDGTDAVMTALVEVTKEGACTIIGGGDSAAYAAQSNNEANVNHVSTGGGATLELLEGKPMPGCTALSDKDKVQAYL